MPIRSQRTGRKPASFFGIGRARWTTIDRGLLTISGERRSVWSNDMPESRRYAQERFVGAFRRVIELPEGADPDKVQARYANGCLSVSVGKREASKPRAITVQ
ncbi:hypothetical protein LMG23994_07174 [Cupriavidus pinatubonensis]|uniref:SHSP domain-containing protein n=2 Tax=Cupriavidus pinatubonensis TaxID=248026 RepID=A0ABN7ZQ60_9BURK|nr:hypothetical protein LMG23994_07174 [Cupriavidus pinatubonensis]